jgi:hypothetical protein
MRFVEKPWWTATASMIREVDCRSRERLKRRLQSRLQKARGQYQQSRHPARDVQRERRRLVAVVLDRDADELQHRPKQYDDVRKIQIQVVERPFVMSEHCPRHPKDAGQGSRKQRQGQN